MSGVLDEQIVNELKDIMGDDIGMLMETFIVDSQQKLEQLKALLKDDDFDAIRRLAHSLKGSSKNVGASALASHCENLEHDARDENLTDRDAYLNNILESFETTKSTINSELLN